MRELVEYIAKSLVDEPDKVRVSQREEDHAFIIEINVAEGDMGKIIGKQGRIAKAVRTVVKAATNKDSKKYIVEIV